MRVEVLLFGGCRQVAGRSALAVEIPEGGGLDALWEGIVSVCPALAAHRGSTRVAINREFAGPDARIVPGDEVALIPPVSGG